MTPAIHPKVRLRVFVIAAALCVALGAWKVVSSGGHAPTDPKPSTNTSALPQHAQRAAFSVLTANTASLGPAMRTAITAAVSASRPLGLRLDLARRVATGYGVVAWVIPGDGYICVVHDGTGTAGCATTAEATRHGMSLIEEQTSFDGPEYLLLGLVPDGVKAVEVLPDRRPPLLVPARNNVYAYLGSTPARARRLR